MSAIAHGLPSLTPGRHSFACQFAPAKAGRVARPACQAGFTIEGAAIQFRDPETSLCGPRALSYCCPPQMFIPLQTHKLANFTLHVKFSFGANTTLFGDETRSLARAVFGCPFPSPCCYDWRRHSESRRRRDEESQARDQPRKCEMLPPPFNKFRAVSEVELPRAGSA